MDILQKIITTKKQELSHRQKTKRQQLQTPHRFVHVLSQKDFSIIGEIKRRSPSAQQIAKIDNPAALAKTYESAGVDAISVLTDQEYFGGSLEDLQQVSQAVTVPLLCKDFFIDPVQFDEAIIAGASCILLIVAAVPEKLSFLYEEATARGLDALIEVHTEKELKQALELQPKLIGINNRDLKTFQVDMETSHHLKKQIPDHIITISESGMHHPEAVIQVRSWGFAGALVGEGLIRSSCPRTFIDKVRDAH